MIWGVITDGLIMGDLDKLFLLIRIIICIGSNVLVRISNDHSWLVYILCFPFISCIFICVVPLLIRGWIFVLS